jgi:hypothetical protein
MLKVRQKSPTSQNHSTNTNKGCKQSHVHVSCIHTPSCAVKYVCLIKHCQHACGARHRMLRRAHVIDARSEWAMTRSGGGDGEGRVVAGEGEGESG